MKQMNKMEQDTEAARAALAEPQSSPWVAVPTEDVELESWPEGCGYQGHEFGAPYLDSICQGGWLFDADDCDEPGTLNEPMRDIPCPQCNKDETKPIPRLATPPSDTGQAADPPPQAEGQGEVYNPMCGCGHRSGQHVRGYPVTKTRFCMAGGCGCNSFQPPSVEDKSKAAE